MKNTYLFILNDYTLKEFSTDITGTFPCSHMWRQLIDVTTAVLEDDIGGIKRKRSVWIHGHNDTANVSLKTHKI